MEQSFSERLEYQKEILLATLKQQGIHIDRNPQHDVNTNRPRTWLARGETNKARLVRHTENGFTPQSGEWGTHGVFLADCLTALSIPSNGAIYIFKADDLNAEWLIYPSDQIRELERYYASKNQLDLRTIDGGVKALEHIYKQFDVYQVRRGIATIHTPFPVEKATSILLSPDFLYAHEREELPRAIREKIVMLAES